MNNNTISKDDFIMVSLFNFSSVFYYKEKFFKRGNIFSLILNKRNMRKFREELKKINANKEYERKLLSIILSLYKKEKLNLLLNDLELKNDYVLNKKPIFITKNSMLDRFYLKNEKSSLEEISLRNFFSLNQYFANETKIKSFLIRDIFYHFIINLYPINYEKSLSSEKSNEILSFLNYSFSPNDSYVDEKISELLKLLNNDFSSFFSKAIPNFFLPFEVNLNLRTIGMEVILVPNGVKKYIKDLVINGKIDYDIFKKFFLNVKNENGYDDFSLMVDILYVDIQQIVYNTYFYKTDFTPYFLKDNNFFWGINIVSTLYKLQEKELLKDVPGLFDLENKFFYFKKFDNYYELFKYADEMIREFAKVFYKGKEYLFFKRYFKNPLNNYFRNCSIKEKAFIVDNFIKKNIFLSKIIARLSNKTLKIKIEENIKDINSEIAHINELSSFLKKSSIKNLLKISILFFKGNQNLYKNISFLKKIERELIKENGAFYKKVDKMIDYLYKKHNISTLINYNQELNPNKILSELIEEVIIDNNSNVFSLKDINKEVVKKSASLYVYFYKDFFEKILKDTSINPSLNI